MKKIYIALVVLILLIGCATTEQQTQLEATPPIEPQEETPVETTPAGEPVEDTTEVIVKIPNDIKEILEKGKTKLKSYSYNYKGPESEIIYGIYIKGNKIKIVHPEIVNVEEGKFYNTLYLDTEKKTAEAYCTGSTCGANLGKVKDLSYEDTYIETPLDWLEKVTEAEQIDKRQVEDRDVLYLNTNIGKIIVESYYGFLYNIEDGANKWEFIDAAFNSVKESDVTPS